jgi:hypothetical protein
MPRSFVFGALTSAFTSALMIACGPPRLAIQNDEEEESTSGGDLDLRPNWHQDVAPIVHARCVGCHHDDGFAPFALHDYAAASAWAPLVTTAVTAQTMPPWGAHDTPECEVAHEWLHDMRLSDTELETLVECDPAKAAPLPTPSVASLDDAQAVFQIPTPTVLEGVFDSHECISIDPGFADEVWITGAELLPDNVEVVHHVLLMLDTAGASAELAGPDGRFACEEFHSALAGLGSYFPGSGPTLIPEQVGVPFPAGARIILNFHYHPTGSGQDIDQSSLALRWTTEPPAYEGIIAAVGNASTAAEGLQPGPNDPTSVPVFFVPAGVSGHTETMAVVIPEWVGEVELFMLAPHMHKVGTDLRATLERDGQTHCLIQDPRWDPNWQLVYTINAKIGEFPTLRSGDRLELRCTYDNSLANPTLVEALARFGLEQPIDVHLGAAGLNEMCMLIYGVAVPR